MIGLFVFLWSINDGRIGSSEALLIVFGAYSHNSLLYFQNWAPITIHPHMQTNILAHAVYVCYTCTVAVMYYRSKAENAAEEARHLAEEQQTCEKAASPHMPHPASPIRRSTSGGRVSPSASDDGNCKLLFECVVWRKSVFRLLELTTTSLFAFHKQCF